jgi:hypothetical protein
MIKGLRPIDRRRHGKKIKGSDVALLIVVLRRAATIRQVSCNSRTALAAHAVFLHSAIALCQLRHTESGDVLPKLIIRHHRLTRNPLQQVRIVTALDLTPGSRNCGNKSSVSHHLQYLV